MADNPSLEELAIQDTTVYVALRQHHNGLPRYQMLEMLVIALAREKQTYLKEAIECRQKTVNILELYKITPNTLK